LDEKCIEILLDDMMSIDELIVVGAWPMPKKPDNSSHWENLLYRILHIRSFYPEAEISVNDVSAYKSYAYTKLQTTVSPEFEVHSRIYFHGRTFMMRNTDFFYLPEDANTTDDTFLPNFIHTKYGPGTIRTRFDALTYYEPYLSLKDHYKAHRRAFWDLENIDKRGEFKESRKKEETRLDWDHIFSKGSPVIFEFLAYTGISFTEEKIIYGIFPKKSTSEVWNYNKK